ncbi:RTA1-like protein [Tricholoma matsutake]|nr:RTA1-like protein [Tricholoma matsutake 945]
MRVHDFRPVTLLSVLVGVSFLITPAGAANRLPHLADPFADPKHDPYNPLRYIASNAMTGVAFSLMLSVAFLQTWCVFKYGAKWMLSMVIGAYFFALGLSIRFGLHSHPDSSGLYIVEYLFVVLSPCTFIAADYILLGRISRHLHSDELLLVSSHRITQIFVTSDITTFLIQAVGGSLTTSTTSPHLPVIGSRIFLAGLVLQLLSFSAFTSIYLVFLYRVYKPKLDIRAPGDHLQCTWYSNWRSLAAALFISCIGILIRSCYRVVELSQGFEGALATSQATFYGLDTLPLFIATAVYIPFWPGRFIQGSSENVVEISGTPDLDEPKIGSGVLENPDCK